MIKTIESNGRLFVGDLHGNVKHHEKICNFADKNGYAITFVGDYVDSFSKSFKEQMDLLEQIKQNIKDDKPYSYLVGNHDLSYMHFKYQCSGFKPKHSEPFKKVFSNILPQLKFFEIFKLNNGENLFVSHAGLSKSFVDYIRLPLDSMEEVEEFFNIDIDSLFKMYSKPFTAYCGYVRGGDEPYGGIFWNDYFREFKPIENLHQIMGHTAMQKRGIAKIELNGFMNFNIDNIEYGEQEILLVQNDTFSIIYKEEYWQ